VEQRYCGHCKLFHESGADVLLDERIPLAPAPNFGASWPAQRAQVLARLAESNPNHPWPKEEQLRQAEADAAALRRLIIAYRNIGMRLATPQTQQWHDILQEAKLAERALYAAVEQPGAGAALLAELAAAQLQLTRAEGLATAAAITLHELTESRAVQAHTRSLLQAAVDAFEASSKETSECAHPSRHCRGTCAWEGIV
jgi:hypothetical protein